MELLRNELPALQLREAVRYPDMPTLNPPLSTHTPPPPFLQPPALPLASKMLMVTRIEHIQTECV